MPSRRYFDSCSFSPPPRLVVEDPQQVSTAAKLNNHVQILIVLVGLPGRGGRGKGYTPGFTYTVWDDSLVCPPLLLSTISHLEQSQNVGMIHRPEHFDLVEVIFSLLLAVLVLPEESLQGKPGGRGGWEEWFDFGIEKRNKGGRNLWNTAADRRGTAIVTS